MSLERRPEEQALKQLILELREQSAPELDWQRMETRLLQAPKPEPRNAVLSFLSRLRLPAAGLVAAAAVAAVVLARRPAPTAALPVAKVSNEPLNGDQLALGTRVTAGNRALVVEHHGRARWTLEPHATASVSDAGEFLTLRLEAGALSAAVVPNPKPETFAVEVGGTRVAVHGTAFRVERVADRVLVSVSEGTVAVEPTGSHSAPAFLLRRDSRGSFALDGRTGNVEGNASAVMSDSGARSHREIAPTEHAAVAHPSAPATHANNHLNTAAPTADEPTPQLASALPVQPSISDIESGVSSAVVLMNRCFHDLTRSGDIRVSANTGLTLTVSGEGAVKSATFAPPLAPAVEDCAVNGLRSLAFAHSVEGVTFTRVLELTR